MSNDKNVLRMNCHVNRLSILIDILNAMERVEGMGHAEWNTVDVTDTTATITGPNVSPLVFQLTSMGYVCRMGPSKTHLFMEVK